MGKKHYIKVWMVSSSSTPAVRQSPRAWDKSGNPTGREFSHLLDGGPPGSKWGEGSKWDFTTEQSRGAQIFSSPGHSEAWKEGCLWGCRPAGKSSESVSFLLPVLRLACFSLAIMLSSGCPWEPSTEHTQHVAAPHHENEHFSSSDALVN